MTEQYVMAPREEYERLIRVTENLIGELSDPGTEALAAVYCARRLLDAAPVAEQGVGNIGRNITFSPFDEESGNAVISPDEPDGPYWTLIAQGGEQRQNEVGAEIVRRLNAALSASPKGSSSEGVTDAEREAIDELRLESAANGQGHFANIQKRDARLVLAVLDRALSSVSTPVDEGSLAALVPTCREANGADQLRAAAEEVVRAHGSCICGSYDCDVMPSGGCLGDVLHRSVTALKAALSAPDAGEAGEPVPMELDCPACTFPHLDEGEWATRPHKTHLCGNCGHEWRPFDYATVGVGFTQPKEAGHD